MNEYIIYTSNPIYRKPETSKEVNNYNNTAAPKQEEAFVRAVPSAIGSRASIRASIRASTRGTLRRRETENPV